MGNHNLLKKLMYYLHTAFFDWEGGSHEGLTESS